MVMSYMSEAKSPVEAKTVLYGQLMSESATSSRRDQRREAILRVAGEVFLEEGYSAASMSTIAARLGGSKGTLYNYFKNKEELFEAQVRDLCGHGADRMVDT